MNNTFSYNKTTLKLILLLLGLTFIVVFNYMIIGDIFFTNWYNFLIYLPIFIIIGHFIYQRFFITITFEEDKVIYKTLFKKRILNKENIREIAICEQVSKYEVEFDSYKNIDSMHSPRLVMIGHIEYYPNTIFKFLFRPSSSTYITLVYRPELNKYLDRFMPLD